MLIHLAPCRLDFATDSVLMKSSNNCMRIKLNHNLPCPIGSLSITQIPQTQSSEKSRSRFRISSSLAFYQCYIDAVCDHWHARGLLSRHDFDIKTRLQNTTTTKDVFRNIVRTLRLCSCIVLMRTFSVNYVN